MIVRSIRFAALSLLVQLGVAAALAAYLKGFDASVLHSWRKWLLLGSICIGTAVLARVYMPLVLPDAQRHFLQFAFPAAAVPMLVASLFDIGLAITRIA